jgi:superoxide reductase
MKKALVCSVCGYIHLKETAPEKCPVCAANSKAFSLKEEALKTNEDIVTTGESHKKHLPVISVNNINENVQEIKVKVGELEHPMIPEHYITNIMFYADNEYAGGIALTSNLKPEGSVSLNVKGKKISVIEHCNIHGDWISEL